VHDRYGPEVRDKIIEKLRTPMITAAYQILTSTHLRILAETKSTEEPVLSVYLQLSPERRVMPGARHSAASPPRRSNSSEAGGVSAKP
jgi:hypothetical protein